jgi:aryl-alcohol dehydrogenase-like predicted oxidoreductase
LASSGDLMQRREFLKAAAVAGVAAAASNRIGNAQAASTMAHSSEMQYRELGRTGEKVSAIGLGGYHIGVQPDPADSIRLIRTAIDRGINFMDNSWDYNDGASESRMGDALQDGYRNKVLLMTKIDGRSKAAFDTQLDQSLSRLKVDHIDLMQFHEIIRMEDPDRIFAAGGAMEGAMAAKQAGKIRYIGFTGHKDPIIHLRMFEVAKQHGFHFDTVQMPINVMDAHFRSFAKQVIPVANAEGTGVLAMKVFAGRAILQSKTVEPLEALHYALSQQVSVVITGMDSPAIMDQAFTAIKDFKPLTETQMAALLARTRDAAMTGQYEPFKTTARVDGTARVPAWLG